MTTPITLAAAAVLIAAGAALPAYRTGHQNGAATVQQRWDSENTQQAQAKTDQLTNTRSKEAGHASQITQAIDDFQGARAPAADDSAVRVADAQRLQRASESRALRFLAMSKASDAERDRLASHAARLDASLAEGRVVAEQLRATVVERDAQVRLLADIIRADRTLFGSGDANAPEP
jgi:hypothetical protein